MPKISITEKDYTLDDTTLAISNDVYIPGKASKKTDIVYCTNVSQLNAIEGVDNTSLAFRMATALLKKGIYVWYQGFVDTPTEEDWEILADKSYYDVRFLTAGDFATGDVTNDALKKTNQYMTDCAKKRGDAVALLDHPLSLIDETSTKSEYTYVLLTSQPTVWESSQYYIKNAVAYKALSEAVEFEKNKYYEKWVDSADPTREMYVVLTIQPDDWENNYSNYFEIDGDAEEYSQAESDLPFELNKFYKQYKNPSTTVAAVRDFFDNISNGEFAAAFTPWFVTKNATLLGDSGQETEFIPASFGYLLAFATAINTYDEWYAVAGSYRGIIDELYNVTYRYTTAEIEILQARATFGEVELDDLSDNTGIAINPIAYVRPYGYIIWGNRTCVNNKGALKATSFLNVRNCVTSIKKSLYNAARKFTFEQNNDILWSKFKNEVRPLLDNMVSSNGLLGYRFEQVATTKKARLCAKIIVVPIEAVEDFQIEVVLTDSLEVSE